MSIWGLRIRENKQVFHELKKPAGLRKKKIKAIQAAAQMISNSVSYGDSHYKHFLSKEEKIIKIIEQQIAHIEKAKEINSEFVEFCDKISDVVGKRVISADRNILSMKQRVINLLTDEKNKALKSFNNLLQSQIDLLDEQMRVINVLIPNQYLEEWKKNKQNRVTLKGRDTAYTREISLTLSKLNEILVKSKERERFAKILDELKKRDEFYTTGTVAKVIKKIV